jgi:hypothetical protein
MIMKLVEIDEGAFDLINRIGDAFRFGKASASSKMDIAKANPPKKDNSSKRNNKPAYKNICGKWDVPKTTGCVRQ